MFQIGINKKITFNKHFARKYKRRAYILFRAGDKGDLSKKFDQVCVWYRWKGYLSGSMENGCWGVASGGIGHQKSFKVTTQGHLKKKCDLTKNFD